MRCLYPFCPTLVCLESHGYTARFLGRKGDYILCSQGQYEIVMESLLQAWCYPEGLLHFSASLGSPHSTPSTTVTTENRFSLFRYITLLLCTWIHLLSCLHPNLGEVSTTATTQMLDQTLVLFCTQEWIRNVRKHGGGQRQYPTVPILSCAP